MEVTKKGKKDWIVKSKSGVSLFMGISLKKKKSIFLFRKTEAKSHIGMFTQKPGPKCL